MTVFKTLKDLYEDKVFDEEDLRKTVIRGWITKEEYKVITKKDY